MISIFDRALRFRTRNSHSDFKFGETFRRAKEEFIISCGTAYELEASQKSFCDVSTVETFLNILMISYCLAFPGSKQSVRSKFLNRF